MSSPTAATTTTPALPAAGASSPTAAGNIFGITAVAQPAPSSPVAQPAKAAKAVVEEKVYEQMESDALFLWKAVVGDESKIGRVPFNKFADVFARAFHGDPKFADWPQFPGEFLFHVLDHFLGNTVRRWHAESGDELHPFSIFDECKEVRDEDVLVYCARFGKFKQSVANIAKHFFDSKGRVHAWYHGDITNRVAMAAIEKPGTYLVRAVPQGPTSDMTASNVFQVYFHHDKSKHRLSVISQLGTGGGFKADTWFHEKRSLSDDEKALEASVKDKTFASFPELFELVCAPRKWEVVPSLLWTVLNQSLPEADQKTRDDRSSYAPAAESLGATVFAWQWDLKRAKLWAIEGARKAGAHLQKKSPSGLQSWQDKFYFTVDIGSTCFRYYKVPDKKTPITEQLESGIIPFNRVNRVDLEGTDVFTFLVAGSLQRWFKWKVENTAERDAWARTVAHYASMGQSTDKDEPFPQAMSETKWWKPATFKSFQAAINFDTRANVAERREAKQAHDAEERAAVFPSGQELGERDLEAFVSNVQDADIKQRVSKPLVFHVVNETEWPLYCTIYVKPPAGSDERIKQSSLAMMIVPPKSVSAEPAEVKTALPVPAAATPASATPASATPASATPASPTATATPAAAPAAATATPATATAAAAVTENESQGGVLEVSVPLDIIRSNNELKMLYSTVRSDLKPEMSLEYYAQFARTTVESSESVYLIDQSKATPEQWHATGAAGPGGALSPEFRARQLEKTDKTEKPKKGTAATKPLLALGAAQYTVAKIAFSSEVGNRKDINASLLQPFAALRAELAKLKARKAKLTPIDKEYTELGTKIASINSRIDVLATEISVVQRAGKQLSNLKVDFVHKTYTLFPEPKKGFGVSPYSAVQTARYLVNGISAGALSEKNDILIPAPSERAIFFKQADQTVLATSQFLRDTKDGVGGVGLENVDEHMGESQPDGDKQPDEEAGGEEEEEEAAAEEKEEKSGPEATPAPVTATGAAGVPSAAGTSTETLDAMAMDVGANAAIKAAEAEMERDQFNFKPSAYTNVPETLIDARHNHPLYRLPTVYAGAYGCNGCPQSQMWGKSGLVWHCDECNYDLCPPCAQEIFTEATAEEKLQWAAESARREKEAEEYEHELENEAEAEIRAVADLEATKRYAEQLTASLGMPKGDMNQLLKIYQESEEKMSNYEDRKAYIVTEVAKLATQLRVGNRMIRVLMLGDLMIMDMEKAAEVSPKLRMEFARADIIIINCESLVIRFTANQDTDIGGKPWKLKFPISLQFIVETLESLNIDRKKTIFSLANNHAGDYGRAGAIACKAFLESIGCIVVGVAEDLTGKNTGMIARVKVNGINVGVLAWTRWMNSKSWLGKDKDSDVAPVFRQEDVKALLDPDLEHPSKDDSKRTKLEYLRIQNEIDYLIGFVHWEFEQSFQPSISTSLFARECLQRGRFDAVIGHGPHVIQPIEVFDIITEKQANLQQKNNLNHNKGIVCYSVGNLCSMRGRWHTKLGGAMVLNIDPNQRAENTEWTLKTRNLLHSYKFIPFVQADIETVSSATKTGDVLDREDARKVRVTRLWDMDDEEGDRYKERYQQVYEDPFGVLLGLAKMEEWWCVRVWTSNALGAGTDNPVQIQAEGSGGRFSPEWTLASAFNSSADFERGSVDTFYLGAPKAIGDLQRIILRLIPNKRKQLISAPKLRKRDQVQNVTSTLLNTFKLDVDAWAVDHVLMLNLMTAQEFHFDVKKRIKRSPVVVERRAKMEIHINPSVQMFLHLTQRFQTGDLIAFETEAKWFDKFRAGGKRQYSSVGIVVVQDSNEFKPVDFNDTLPVLRSPAELAKFNADQWGDAEEEEEAAPEAGADAKKPEDEKALGGSTRDKQRCWVKDHLHQLKLTALPYGVAKGYAFKYKCNICNTERLGTPSYQCAPCKYDMCVPCAKKNALWKPPLREKDKDAYKAISTQHQHELSFCLPFPEGFVCSRCGIGQGRNVPAWHCGACNFNMCIPCMTPTYTESTLLRIYGGRRQVLVYESTSALSSVPDITSGYRAYAGVHAFTLRQRVGAQGLTDDGTRLTHIPLKAPLSANQASLLIQWLREQHFLKIPFDTSNDFLGESSFLKKLGVNKKDDLTKLFSSELVAAALKHACALPKDSLALDFSPDDLVNCPIYAKEVATVITRYDK